MWGQAFFIKRAKKVSGTQTHRPCESGNCGAKLQKNFRIKIYQLHEAPEARKNVAPGVSPGALQN